MRPHHKFAVFEGMDRDMDRKLQTAPDDMHDLNLWRYNGETSKMSFYLYDWGEFVLQFALVCVVLEASHIDGLRTYTYIHPGKARAYDYGKMREEMTPFRIELLRYVMHPVRWTLSNRI
jgi:hypothetical protein